MANEQKEIYQDTDKLRQLLNQQNGKKFQLDWGLNELAWELYWWADFFNIAFFKVQPVPVPVISFEKTRVTKPRRQAASAKG